MRPMISAALLLTASTALAQDPMITHQGRLIDVNGTPLNGDVDLRISLFDTEVSTPAEWTRLFQNEPVQDGYYAVALVRDDANAALDPADFADGEVWVQVQVDGQAMGGRERLASVPSALHATTASSATTAQTAQTATSAARADVAGDLSVNHGYLSPSLGTPDWLDNAAYIVCASKHSTMRYLEAPGAGQSCSSKCSDGENPGNGCLAAYGLGGNVTPWATYSCSATQSSLQWCCCTW